MTIELKTPAEIDVMREAGRVVARCLEAVRAASAPGVSLSELDTVAHDVMREHDATPAFLDYHPHFAPSPYPGVICASVNDAVVHAIPGAYRLAEGDLVSVDIGAVVDGWCGDAAVSYVTGPADPADLALIDTTERALHAGIAAARHGHTLGDIGAAVAGVARPAGYGMLADHGGHGVGRAMHEQPHVPNEGRAGKGLTLQTGLVIAIEPMLHAGGSDDYRHDPDGWTLRTADGSRAAHERAVGLITAGARPAERTAYLAHTRALLAAADVYRDLDRRFFHLLTTDADPRPLPEGFDDEVWVRPGPPPGPVPRALHDGDGIDLGGRVLTVLHTPGHSPDSICLLDDREGVLLGGDTLNSGPIYAQAAESDLGDFARSTARLAGLARDVSLVGMGHFGRAVAEPRYLAEVAEAFDRLVSGDPSVEFRDGRDCDDAEVREAVFAQLSVLLPGDR